MNEETEIIKCNKCGHVLMSGSGNVQTFLTSGCKLSCLKCGNSHVIEKPINISSDSNQKNTLFKC